MYLFKLAVGVIRLLAEGLLAGSLVGPPSARRRTAHHGGNVHGTYDVQRAKSKRAGESGRPQCANAVKPVMLVAEYRMCSTPCSVPLWYS